MQTYAVEVMPLRLTFKKNNDPNIILSWSLLVTGPANNVGMMGTYLNFLGG